MLTNSVAVQGDKQLVEGLGILRERQ